MEILNYCSQRICDSPFDSRKQMLPWIPAAISAAASIGSALFSNKSNKDLAQKAYLQQQDYNNWLLRNQTQESVKDLRAAGLNPAFMNGAQMANTPSPPSYDVPQMQSPIDFGSAMLFGQIAAQTRKTNAEANAQELLNADKEAKNNALNQEYVSRWEMPDGSVISDSQADELFASGSNELPSFVRIKDIRANNGAEGRFEGQKMLRQWRSEINNLDASDLRNELNKIVTSGQIDNPSVVKALVEMPDKEFRQLAEIVTDLSNYNSTFDTRRQILEIELDMSKTQLQIQKDSNLYQYINKMFDGDFEWKDFGKLLAMTLVGLFQNIGGIGVGLTNLKNLGSSGPTPVRGFR